MICEKLIRMQMEEEAKRSENEPNFDKISQCNFDEEEDELKRLYDLLFDENGNNTFNKNYHKFQAIDLELFWEWTKRHPSLQFNVFIGGNSVCVQNGHKIQPSKKTLPYRIELDDEEREAVVKVYEYWCGCSKRQGNANIFKNILKKDFLMMIQNADFSNIDKRNNTQKMQGCIYILSSLLKNKEWGKVAARSIGTELRICQKRSGVHQCLELKDIVFQ